MMRRTGLIFLISVLLLTTGCASSRKFDEMSIRLDVIEQQNSAIEDKLVEVDSLTESLLEALTVFKARTEFSDKAGDARLDEINAKLNDLMDRTELIQGSITSLQRGLVRTPISEDTVGGVQQDTITYVDARKIFDTATKDLTASDYSLAILGFKEYIKLYPDAELADDAQFLIGEAYYRQADYAQARDAYLIAEKSYPNSDRMATILYKLGRCNQELGDTRKSTEYFNATIEKFPDTQEAELARERLDSSGG
jgi:tol-pal system protein YbgF